MSDQIEVLASGLAFPEGPAFAPDGALWCVELRGGNLLRWADGHVERFACGGEPNGLAFDARGDIWICDAGRHAIRRFSPTAGHWTTVVDALDGVPLARPNDLAFDATGNLVFTCPGDSRFEPSGYVCCLGLDGHLRRIADGMYFPNGLAFDAEAQRLSVAESWGRRLWQGDWNGATCTWSAAQPWAELGEPPGPDGIAFDAAGLLYVATYRSGQVKVVGSAGQVVCVYDVPGQYPTNVAFDPSGRLGLVVTEAEKGLLLSLPWLGPGLPLFMPASGSGAHITSGGGRNDTQDASTL